MDNHSFATTMIGEKARMPIAIAPMGFTGMMWAFAPVFLFSSAV